MDITAFVISQRESALLIGDYNTYRAQLSRRLLAVRKRLGRTTARNGKYTEKAPITAEQIQKNPEYAHLLLLIAERAWAHAMHMKSAHSEENAGKGITGSTRRHIITRFNKAFKYARELVDLLHNQSVTGATDTDVLEAEAYARSLTGAEEFEKQSEGARTDDTAAQGKKWEKCLVAYSEARMIYNALLRTTKKEIFKDILASTVDPSIRYAAYQSHLPRSRSVSSIAQDYFKRSDSELISSVRKLDPEGLEEKKATDAKGPSVENVPNTISWRGRTANISDAAIGQALAAVSTAEARLLAVLAEKDAKLSNAERAGAYDDVLLASQDAADSTRHAIDELEKERVGEGDPRMQDLRVTSLAVNYDLIGWRVGRNRTLLGKDDGLRLEEVKVKPPRKTRKDGTAWKAKEEGNGKKLARLRERVALYDTNLQSIDSIKDLRGAMRDTTFVQELESKRAYFQALKCLNIAYSHSLLSHQVEALALAAHAKSLSEKVVSGLPSRGKPASGSPPRLDVQEEQAQALDQHLEHFQNRLQGLVELQKFSDNSAIANQKHMTTSAPLVERLHEYPINGVDLKNLVDYPPKLRPIPVKPIFLDLAWNYIDYPGQAKKVVETEQKTAPAQEPEQEKKQEPAKKGWFGWGRS